MAIVILDFMPNNDSKSKIIVTRSAGRPNGGTKAYCHTLVRLNGVVGSELILSSRIADHQVIYG